MVLAARDRGEGRPIVLLPWFGLDGIVMALAFESTFADISGWRRIYLDLPGTGGSPAVAANSDAVLDAVSETVESALGAAPYLVAGCSYGGYLAAGLARRHPAQIAGLFMVCAGVKIQPEERNLSRLVASTPQPHWLDDVPKRLHDHFAHAIGHQTRSVAGRILQAFTRNGPSDDTYLDELRSTGYRLPDENAPRVFTSPTAIVAGRQDRVAGYLDLFAALDSYPQGSYHALNAAGHYLPFEQPDHFATLVRDWLARADAT
jgi:pimeloyl-ACP methyl ester carboxylesterase